MRAAPRNEGEDAGVAVPAAPAGHRRKADEIGEGLVVGPVPDRGLCCVGRGEPRGAVDVVPGVRVEPFARLEQGIDVGSPAFIPR